MGLLLGPVHTYQDLFENASSFICFGFSSTWRWRFQSQKTKLFEDALQSGSFRKRCFHVVVWTGENRAFENTDMTVSIYCISEHALSSLGIMRVHFACLFSFIKV